MPAAALIGLALTPVAMTSLGGTNPGESRALEAKTLFQASPVGVVGAGVAGLMVGSFYAVAVAFSRQIGLAVSETALFMSVVVPGGLAAQLSTGTPADRHDRHRHGRHPAGGRRRLAQAGHLRRPGPAPWRPAVGGRNPGGATSRVHPPCAAPVFPPVRASLRHGKTGWPRCRL